MKKIIFVIVLLLCGQTGFTQSAEQIGRDFIRDFFDEAYDKATVHFDQTMKTQASPAMLAQLKNNLTAQLGDFNRILEVNTEKSGEMDIYYFYSEFKQSSLDVILVLMDNEIAGLQFNQHKEFNVTYRYGEDYLITSNGLELPGTLVIPQENNRHILAVLVHGSGPNNRDEKIGDNKPFLDIAEGLMQRGIASYRYDKRTYVAPASLPEKFTPDDEVITDVLHILDHFKTDPAFSGYKIAVIGHSLGAMLTPQILHLSGQEADAAVMMAANARPLETLVEEQLNYIKEHTVDKAPLEKEISKLKKQIRFLNSPQFSIDAPADSLPLQLPASYWKYLKTYNPTQTALQTNQPLLILQGAFDYQVTLTDFELWKKKLRQRKKVTFKSYPGLNHLFMGTEYPSTPADYQQAGHVATPVIDDIAAWLINQF